MIPRIPVATYRLQFREGMTFRRAAREVVPLLARTGASHLYASPLFRAASGSTHGYDVADHRELEPALGGREGFEALSAALREAGLGLVLDIVPNHMVASPENPWWRDVLRHGRSSRYARHFDIDWDRPKLLLTQLGAPYGEVLAAGELALGREADGPVLRYYDNAFPLLPATWRAAAPGIDLPEEGGWAEWIADAGNAERLDAALADADAERLHAVHEAQPWRLAHWRAARDMLGHRRFFEITDLVGVRVEDERVFDDVHAGVFDLIREGHVHGLRIDHVDGVADPTGYLATLRERAPRLAGGESVPVWVEKILAPGEWPPAEWPIEGTTGYVAGRAIAGVLTDRAAEGALTGAYAAFTGDRQSYETMLRAAKREIITVNLAAELDVLTRLAVAAAADDLAARDYGPDSVRIALVALMTAMPVYRTYVTDAPSDADRAVLERVREAASADPVIEETGPLDFLVSLIAERGDGAARAFRTRLQQTTGAVMAKSLEDTLFYRTHRLIALNEVGAEPDHFGLAHEDWHGEMAARVASMPHGLIATATHDTKRGEDARMRITAISFAPEEWAALVGRHDRQLVMEHPDSPNPNTRWLFYQALLGAFEEGQPRATLAARMTDYMIKAAREAKLRTSWVAPDEGHEERVRGFVAFALADGNGFLDAFLADAAPFMERGRTLSLQQLALKCTMPGVPDFYQGTSLGDYSLVDPDNRRPVDWALRARVLDAVEAGETPPDGMGAKAALMMALLRLRADERVLFESGGYRPLAARYETEREGDAARPLAFAREHDGRAVVTVIDHRMDGRALLVEWPYGEASPLEETALERRDGELCVVTPRPAHVLRAG